MDKANDAIATVWDLPQLYSQPTASTLLSTLSCLSLVQSVLSSHVSRGNHCYIQPGTSAVQREETTRHWQIDETGLPAYLTRIISSPLHWIEDDAIREEIWAAAASRLAERAGRTALPSLMRTFRIPVPKQRLSRQQKGAVALSAAVNAERRDTSWDSSINLGTFRKIHDLKRTGYSESEYVDIAIREPSLTGDNLGHKTWVSSYVLGTMLPTLLSQYCAGLLSGLFTPDDERGSSTLESKVADTCRTEKNDSKRAFRILELGSGTGLLGLACAAILHRWSTSDSETKRKVQIHLTDLPAIVENLRENVARNRDQIGVFHNGEGNNGETDQSKNDWQEGNEHEESDLPRVVVTVGELDWSKIRADAITTTSKPSPPLSADKSSDPGIYEQSERPYDLILAADSIYAKEHVAWLVNTIATYLTPKPTSSNDHTDLADRPGSGNGDTGRVIICLPYRPHPPSRPSSLSKSLSRDAESNSVFEKSQPSPNHDHPVSVIDSEEHQDPFHVLFRSAMHAQGLKIVEQGRASGWDDWGSASHAATGMTVSGFGTNVNSKVDGDGDQEEEDETESEKEGRVNCWWSIWSR